ncbi:MAG: M6 family metalloprotease domain-containing protein [Candidatus Krumholzibacteria bacterium]|nr:M6 family metalloprotease domain-containing protein [Candidatus Krumholzibacteria bacterium]
MKLTPYLLWIAPVLVPAVAHSQIVPPKPGVDMPQAYYDQVAKDKKAFQFDRAWIGKAQRAKLAREAYLAQPREPGVSFSSLPAAVRQKIAVTGTIEVPVIMIKYADTPTDPYPASSLQAQLFDGPNPTGTMTELYTEMSYGNVTLTGTVYGWVQASQDDLYYEGGAQGLSCTQSKTGQLILEALQSVDGSVDFGIYDNDGPDGIANSGDDDGLVDFVAIVQPEIGAECDNGPHMWSHRWVVGGWPEFGNVCGNPQAFGSPWPTNDPSANGGGEVIRVWDYTVQPAVGSNDGCDPGIVEIGVFSHEFGHAFGLPDLYDIDFGGEGIGFYGLMGSGNWNRPTNPAHMSVWSKMELGWVLPTDVGPVAQAHSIGSINLNPQAYALSIFEDKFARSNLDPIAGSFSLHCGLDAGSAAARNWQSGTGYGNGWNESVRKTFVYDGSNPVTLTYDVRYDTEPGYDFGRIKIRVGGTETTLKSYTGRGGVTGETVDLSQRLSSSGASSYEIIAEFASDRSWSDEDGDFDSGPGGPFKLDNISLVGGGEDYFTDFEQYEDGWHHEFGETPANEFFLVENRSRLGRFDQHLSAEGLFIWHIEQNVARTVLGNTGGTSGISNLRPAGVTMMEADGLRHLLLGSNRGDAGDVFPGSTGNRTFNNSTVPNSKSHNGWPTNAVVNTISNAGATMTATMRAGRFALMITSVTPNFGSQNSIVPITELSGDRFVYGAEILLRDAFAIEYPAAKVDWVGSAKLTGELDLAGVPSAGYDVVVRNPDGQEAVFANGFTVTDPGAVAIQDFSAAVSGTDVQLSWQLSSDDSVRGFNILRRLYTNPVETIVNPQLLPQDTRTWQDDSAKPGTSYLYSLAVVFDDNSQLRSQPFQVTTSAYKLALFQNAPNPFNPITTISFSLPNESFVSLNIYDVNGRLVTTLVDEVRAQGPHQEPWDGTNARGDRVTSGVYFYNLRTGGTVLSRKLVLLR